MGVVFVVPVLAGEFFKVEGGEGRVGLPFPHLRKSLGKFEAAARVRILCWPHGRQSPDCRLSPPDE